MPTNLALDDKMILAAQRLGKHKTKREAVAVALEEYIKRRERMKILDLFGEVDFDPEYNYKASRKRR